MEDIAAGLEKYFEHLAIECSGFHRQIIGRTCNCSLFREHRKKKNPPDKMLHTFPKQTDPASLGNEVNPTNYLSNKIKVENLELALPEITTGFFKITRCH